MIANVAFPISLPGVYDYSVPKKFEATLKAGTPVKVSLRNRELWGVVVSLSKKSRYDNLKEIIEAKSEDWSRAGQSIMELYNWIASYYQSDVGKLFKPIIKRKIADMKEFKCSFYTFSTFPRNMTVNQRKAALLLSEKKSGTEFSREEILSMGITDYMLGKLLNIGAVKKIDKTVVRNVENCYSETNFSGVLLNSEQQSVLDTILANGNKKPFLLHGITGSGKTHVYIELAKSVINEGKGVIILVPEISLTPQTIDRFANSLNTEIAVIHSRMSDGERRDSVEEIISGRSRVVIGVRSAILIPMVNLGLIVVDEEHDHSYKQSDPEPRYHARDVAVMRGFYQNAMVLLGSATPSLESYRNALSGKYYLLELKRRHGNASLPVVKIADMKREREKNNWTPLSELLEKEIEATVLSGKQVILLINRRGFSVSIICKRCGKTYVCPNCSVNMVYHKSEGVLKCHQCDYAVEPPSKCPDCGSDKVKLTGTGIQKVEEYIENRFGDSRIIRMDQDTTRLKNSHATLLQKFRSGAADILIGTQMVAKGLDFPNVKLVGVLQADLGLAIPDFRAAERTFQLITQVSGRAGRKEGDGRVVIQSYDPEQYSIRYAVENDYEGFYNEEIAFRKELFYPPYSRLTRIIVSGEDDEAVSGSIEKMAEIARREGGGDIIVLGPTRAVLEKVKNNFRYSMLMKSLSPSKTNALLSHMRSYSRKFSKNIKFKFDVDPVNMM